MKNKGIQNLIIVIIYALVLLLFLLYFKPIIKWVWDFITLFKPLYYGITLAFILYKPCMFLEKILKLFILKNVNKSITRGISIFFTYFFVVGIITLIIRFVIPQFIENINMFVRNIDLYLENLQTLLGEISEKFNVIKIDTSTFLIWVRENVIKLDQGIEGILTQLIEITTGLITFIVNIGVGIVLSIYLLSGKEKIIYQLKSLLKTYLPKRIYKGISYLVIVSTDVFNKYIIGQFIEAIILGFLCFIGMVIFGLDYPLLISILVLITSLIPLIGAFIGGGVAFLLLIMISPKKAILFLIFLIILQLFEGNVIYPKIVGSKLGLPAIWVLLSIVLGGGLLGPIGILLSIPITTTIYVIIRNDIKKRSQKLKSQ